MTNKQNIPTSLRVQRNSVFTFFRLEQQRQAQMQRMRRSEILRSAFNRLRDFRNGTDLPFSKFDSQLMENFEAHLLAQGLRRNTVGFYMRTLRTYYNLAVEKGLTTNRNPFRHVYKSKDKTVKRALTISELRAIRALDLSCHPALDFARDMLLFSFYARGMSFVDMSFLRKSDLQGDHFVYRRRKTGQTLCVEWVWQMQEILDKYRPVSIKAKAKPGRPRKDAPKDTPKEFVETTHPYLLPIITRSDKDPRRQYLNQSMCISRNLRKVGVLAGVSGSCTLYRARHTWATLARYNNVPLAVISEALGHDNERTTQIYLDSIQSQVVDRVNRQLLDSI